MFAGLRMAPDAKMKQIAADGIEKPKKQAEVILKEQEEAIWTVGLLGSRLPESLLNTMVFNNGLYFALQSGKEY